MKSHARTEADKLKKNRLLLWAMWYLCQRAFLIGMPKRGEKGAVVEDGEDPKMEPEVKKSKVGAKINEKEAAEEGPVLHEDPPDQTLHPVANLPHSRPAPGM